MDTVSTPTLREKLLPAVTLILDRDVTRNEKLFAVCELLADEVEHFDWVGFYMASADEENMLVLGPFVGEPTDHVRIPYGRGICGQVAVSRQTFVSQNVHAEDNYLACSTLVHAEIVAPILKEDTFVAQLDIDSHQSHSITPEKKELVEEICKLLSEEF